MPENVFERRRRCSLIFIWGITFILISISILTPITWGEYHESLNNPNQNQKNPSYSESSTRAITLEWPMFGKDNLHSNSANPVSKGIYQPAEKWDHWDDYISGNGIDSWGTTIGNFTANINGNYDRNVEHIVYAENGFINIADGGSGELIWRLNVDLIDSITDSDVVFTTPTLGFVNNNQYLDIVFGTNDGILYMYEPESNYDNVTGYSWSTNNVNLDKVWEFTTNENITQSSPVLGKIDTDNFPDIAVGAGDKLFTVSGTSGTELWNRTLAGNVISSPIIYKDGIKNRVMVTSFRQSNLNFSASFFDAETGNTLDIRYFDLGLSANTLNLLPSPAAAELDGKSSNDKELIVAIPFQGIIGNGRVNVYYTNRSLIWSSGSTITGQIDATPAVGDLDGDSIPEIVVLSWAIGTLGPISHLYAFHGNNGSLMWHIVKDTISVPPYTFERTVSPPILADLNGDDKRDVLFATSPSFFAVDGLNGTSLWEYSFTQTGRQLWSAPAAADIDNDNFLDVVFEGAAISHVIIDLTMTASDFYLSSENINENQQVTIYAIVHNLGSAPAENVKVSFGYSRSRQYY
jgi:outer membrane protein assembly factor BamB